MRSAIVALALLLGFSTLRPARAESRPEALAPLVFDSSSLERAYKKARNRRNLGIALAVPGVASSVVACVLAGYAANHEPNLFSQAAQGVVAVVLGLAGLAVGIPGAILWVNNQDEMDVVRWRRKQLATPLVSVSPTGGAVGLRFSF